MGSAPGEQQAALRSTAFHEAGHFVASYLLKPTDARPCVTIVPSPEKECLGHLSDEGAWYDAEEAEAEVMVLLAGHAAQKLVDPGASLDQASSDTERAEEILCILGQADQLAEWRTRADDFAGKHRADISAVAQQLLVHRRLDGEEAEAVVDIVRGDATQSDLVAYRTFRAACGDRSEKAGET